MRDWAAVATVVNDRMQARKMTQKELAEKSGVSPATLRKIQQGTPQNRTDAILSAVSRALGLPDDHLRKVAGGQGATSDAGDTLSELRAEVADLRRRVDDLEREVRRDS